MTSRNAVSRALAASLVSVVPLLAGCGGDDPGPTASPSSESSDQSEPGVLVAGKATCKLKEISRGRATLEQTGSGLVMTFTGLPVPPSGTVLYSVRVYDEAGETGGQLGVSFLEGEQTGYFYFSFESGSEEQTNIDATPEISGGTVTARFTKADLDSLGDVQIAKWSPAFSVNGQDFHCFKDYAYRPFPQS